MAAAQNLAGIAPVGVQTPESAGVGAISSAGIDQEMDLATAPSPVVDKDVFVSEFHNPMVDGKQGNNAVAHAMDYIGTPYVWGGNGYGGIDCSGLVQQVYPWLPRLSSDQARSGARVDIKALRPGDLVAWDNSSRNNGADHIAIYAGDGYIIEAPRTGLNVRRRKLDADDAGAWGVRITKGN